MRRSGVVHGAAVLLWLGGSGCAGNSVDPAATEVRAAAADSVPSPSVARRDRFVHLQLRGLPGGDYRLHIDCESGRSLQEPGRASGQHGLWLPPGPCVVTVHTEVAARPQRFEHVFTVTAEPDQHVVFDVVSGS
jgi:hypothetical protein